MTLFLYCCETFKSGLGNCHQIVCSNTEELTNNMDKIHIWFVLFEALSLCTGCTGLMNVTIPSPAEYGPPFLLYGEEFCEDRRHCSPGLSYPDKNCYCDSLCHIMGDCCVNIDEVEPNRPEVPLTKSQFTCSRISGLFHVVGTYGALIVSACHPDWQDTTTRDFCEQSESYISDEDSILGNPVSDKRNIMYKNMYCAYCNYEYDILFWPQEYKCVNKTDVRYIPGSPECMKTFLTPASGYTKRLCPLIPPVNTCLETARPELVQNCTEAPYYVVYNDFDISVNYKNEYCAMCNGLPPDRIWCESIIPTIAPPPETDPRSRSYSFRILVDFNNRYINVNGSLENQKTECADNEIYDFVIEKCREIICIPPAEPSGGRCVITSDSRLAEDSPALDNCTWVKFTEGEYRIYNDSNLLILSQEKVYSEREYKINGSDVFICLDRNQSCLYDCEQPGVRFDFNEVESVISLIGLIISLVSLTLTFIIYISFSQLMNTPGKILLCLIIALWIAQLLFLLSSSVENIRAMCIAFALGIHYFFLAAFCWMNVISFDLWMTFSQTFRTSGSSSRSGRRLRLYHLYAWTIPMAIVIIGIILDFSNFNIEHPTIKPGYGNGVCWISSRDALLAFFIGPLALFKIVDIVSFIFTAINIAKAKREGAMARSKKNTCSLLINIKLSLVMGLTWVFAFFANLTNVDGLWYLFIIFNTLQGLFIALSFLCTKKIGRLVHGRYTTLTSAFSNTTSGTQLTNVSKST